MGEIPEKRRFPERITFKSISLGQFLLENNPKTVGELEKDLGFLFEYRKQLRRGIGDVDEEEKLLDIIDQTQRYSESIKA